MDSAEEACESVTHSTESMSDGLTHCLKKNSQSWFLREPPKHYRLMRATMCTWHEAQTKPETEINCFCSRLVFCYNMSFHEDEEWKLFDCICTLRWRDGWQKHSLEAVSSSVWFTVRLFQRSRDKNMFLWLCEARVWGSCGHWEDSVWTDCEEAELPSLALAASFCLSSLISFSSSLSLLSSWARPRSSETDRKRKKGLLIQKHIWQRRIEGRQLHSL